MIPNPEPSPDALLQPNLSMIKVKVWKKNQCITEKEKIKKVKGQYLSNKDIDI